MEDYLKAIDFLTISNENKLILENQQVKRHNLQIEMDKSNIFKIKGTRTFVSFKEDIRRTRFIKNILIKIDLPLHFGRYLFSLYFQASYQKFLFDSS